MEDRTDVREIEELARRSVETGMRVGMVAGVPAVVLKKDEHVQVINEALERAQRDKDGPLRRTGRSEHLDADSFIAHVNRYKQANSVIWANTKDTAFTAVYDYHPAGDRPREAGWQEFRASYDCPMSSEWGFWLDETGGWMRQEHFAELLEQRNEDLIQLDGGCTPLDLLGVARNLQVRTKGTFHRRIVPETGEYELVNKLEHTEGSTKIPRKFGVRLRVFEGGAAYQCEMRLQFRTPDGAPKFRLALHRAGELVSDAFSELRTLVAERTGVTVFCGFMV